MNVFHGLSPIQEVILVRVITCLWLVFHRIRKESLRMMLQINSELIGSYWSRFECASTRRCLSHLRGLGCFYLLGASSLIRTEWSHRDSKTYWTSLCWSKKRSLWLMSIGSPFRQGDRVLLLRLKVNLFRGFPSSMILCSFSSSSSWILSFVRQMTFRFDSIRGMSRLRLRSEILRSCWRTPRFLRFLGSLSRTANAHLQVFLSKDLSYLRG